MYTTSGGMYAGNVAMYSSTGVNVTGGNATSPGTSAPRRLPLLLRQQPPDGEEPTYVTVKAKKWKVLSVFRKVHEFF